MVIVPVPPRQLPRLALPPITLASSVCDLSAAFIVLIESSLALPVTDDDLNSYWLVLTDIYILIFIILFLYFLSLKIKYLIFSINRNGRQTATAISKYD
jgi:hypothetical protein